MKISSRLESGKSFQKAGNSTDNIELPDLQHSCNKELILLEIHGSFTLPQHGIRLLRSNVIGSHASGTYMIRWSIVPAQAWMSEFSLVLYCILWLQTAGFLWKSKQLSHLECTIGRRFLQLFPLLYHCNLWWKEYGWCSIAWNNSTSVRCFLQNGNFQLILKKNFFIKTPN